MSGTTLPSVPTPTISATGIAVPTYEDYYDYLVGVVQFLYGTDINIDSDTQDGQLIGVQAQAMADTANAACNAYNAMSPNTAQGVGLSSVVKINGIARESAFNSTVLQTINGVVGTTIENGIVADILGNQWSLPASVTIPTGGTINVTATAVESGPIAAAVNSLTVIVTPTAGWYTTTNPDAAAPGSPIEQDGELRQRQTLSTALPSQAIVIGLQGALLALPDVDDAVVYENDTSATVGVIPAKSIWAVVYGGNNAQIGTTIATLKSLGCGTYGNTSYTYNPPNGQPPITINYGIPTQDRIIATLTLTSNSSYTSDIGAEAVAALSAYINSTGIGGLIEWDECILQSKWLGNPQTSPFNNDSLAFRVAGLTLGLFGGSQSAADLQTAQGHIATSAITDITLVVT
jgi:uncharacterized phage protein gp47/JayE